MNINPTTWFVIGILTLMVMAFVSNSGTESTANIQDQIYLNNCPMPIYDGVATITDVNDFGVTYTLVNGNGTSNEGTYFECSVTAHLNGANTIIKEYGATLFSTIPYGWLGYIADYITSGFQHLQAFFTMVVYLLTPVNIDVFGYTISDINGLALVFVIGIYIFAYVGIIWNVAPMVLGVIQRVV